MVPKAPLTQHVMKQNVIAFLFCLVYLTASLEILAQDILPSPKNGKVYVIAHRGAHDGIPENSLAAYQKAIDLGCDFVEIDVRTTKDRQMVSVHNSTIDSYVKGKAGKVRDMTLDELKKLDIGEKLGEQWKGTRIPSLEEILQLCQGKMGIYLDLKDADTQQITELIKKYGMERHIVWYVHASFHKALMEIKQFCESCLIMPDPGAVDNIERVVAAYQPRIIATDMGQLSGKFVTAVHEKQAMVFVDDSEDDPKKREAEWQRMIDWGTDGIQTDHPEELIGFLKGNK
jgi:glycerophosphoryl diester phosphodiesterase